MNPLRPGLLLSLLVAALATVVLSACSGEGDAGAGAATDVVPARASVYVEATIRPDGELADDVEALGQKLLGTDDLKAEIRRLIDREAEKEDPSFSFEDDVDSWLGDRVGFFLTDIRADDAQGAAIAAVSDSGKAQEELSKLLREGDGTGKKPKVVERTYKDTDYEVDTANEVALAVLGDHALIGTEPGIQAAIDAKDGDSLADSDEYKKATDEVTDDGLGLAYVRMSQVFSGFGPEGAVARQALGGFGDTFAIALDAGKDELRFESAALGVDGPAGKGPGDVLGELPGDAWLAFGSADWGGQMDRTLRRLAQLGALSGANVDQVLEQLEQQTGLNVERDLISWMGDAGVFVSGDTPAEIGGALVIRSKDEAATRRAIPRIRRTVTAFGEGKLRVRDLRRQGVDAGFTIVPLDLGMPVHLGLAGDRFFVAVTDRALEQVIRPGQPLKDAQAFTDAKERLDDDLSPSFFLNLDPVRSLVDATGAVTTDEARDAREVLDHITSIVAGGERDGTVQRGELVAGVK